MCGNQKKYSIRVTSPNVKHEFNTVKSEEQVNKITWS